MIINPYAFGVAQSYLLDTYSGAAAAYSLRKLSSTYTGNAIRVRRSSDNTEQNIGFDSNGNLDTTALTTFVGANNGFVTTWYDQSGNNKNAIQSSAGSQPRIVTSGTILTKNTKPTLEFNGHNLVISSSQNYFKPLHDGTTKSFVMSVFYRTSSDTYRSIMSNNGGNTSTIGIQLSTAPNWALNDYTVNGSGGVISFNLSANNTTSNGTLTMYSMEWDPSNSTASNRSKMYINNGTAIQNNSSNGTPSSSNATYDMNIGSLGSGISNLVGGICELIVYHADKNAQLTGINSNINTFYSIY